MMNTLRGLISKRDEFSGKVLGLLIEYFDLNMSQLKEILEELSEDDPIMLLLDFYRFVSNHSGEKLHQRPMLKKAIRCLMVETLNNVKPAKSRITDDDRLELTEWLFRQLKNSNGKVDPVFRQWFCQLLPSLEEGSLTFYLDRWADDEFRRFVLSRKVDTQQNKIKRLENLLQITNPDQNTLGEIKLLRDYLIPKIGQDAVMEIVRNYSPQLVVDR